MFWSVSAGPNNWWKGSSARAPIDRYFFLSSCCFSLSVQPFGAGFCCLAKKKKSKLVHTHTHTQALSYFLLLFFWRRVRNHMCFHLSTLNKSLVVWARWYLSQTSAIRLATVRDDSWPFLGFFFFHRFIFPVCCIVLSSVTNAGAKWENKQPKSIYPILY